LHMNGREVFNFVATRVAPDLEALLKRAGLEKSQIDTFLFHQGSRYILETLSTRMKVPLERIPIGLEDIGNTVSSSIPLLLAQEFSNAQSKTLLLCGFGVGLSWASCICKRKD
jgi:3-oxoacyl-[acyl-carrier-protein] synthase-3